MDFEARVHRVAQQLIPQNGNQGYPPMVVSYFRQPPVILPADGSLPAALPPVNPRLLDTARRLGALVDFLVITANGVHAFQDEIERAAGCKVLSMVDVTVGAVQRRNLKHVGIVDFRPAHLSVYPHPLDQAGIRWEALPTDMLPALYQAALAVGEGRAGREEDRIARAGLAHLRARNVDGIILACTEIPFMLHDSDTEMDLINPAELLAEATVRFAIQ
jgi:aspartate racemase